MFKLANPARFNRLADRALPFTLALALICFGAGLYYALIVSPPDYQQGEAVRIMYVHVPAAWMSMAAYAMMAAASGVYLVWKAPLAALAAKAAAPVGLTFTGLALITGSLWGKPMWGAWWVWDARLTSVLVMFFLYLGYLAMWQVMGSSEKTGKATSILAVVGVINLPIIKFSVEWWNTLHQPASVIRPGGPAIDPAMLTPLLLMAAAYLFYFVTVFLWRIQAEIAGRRVETLMRERAKWA